MPESTASESVRPIAASVALIQQRQPRLLYPDPQFVFTGLNDSDPHQGIARKLADGDRCLEAANFLQFQVLRASKRNG